MSYTKTTWTNGATALSADNMNHIEGGIKDAHDALDNVYTKTEADAKYEGFIDTTDRTGWSEMIGVASQLPDDYSITATKNCFVSAQVKYGISGSSSSIHTVDISIDNKGIFDVYCDGNLDEYQYFLIPLKQGQTLKFTAVASRAIIGGYIWGME